MTVAPADASATLAPAFEKAAISAKLTVAEDTPDMPAPEKRMYTTGQASGDAVTDGETVGVAAFEGDTEGLVEGEAVADAESVTLAEGERLHVADSDALAVAVGLGDAVLDVVGQLPR